MGKMLKINIESLNYKENEKYLKQIILKLFSTENLKKISKGIQEEILDIQNGKFNGLQI